LGRSYPGSDGIVDGVVYEPQAVVEVRWKWLTFLIAQVILSSVFLAFTVFQTRNAKIPAWKCSALATMVSLSKETQESVNRISDFGSLKQEAKKMNVRLETGRSEGRLVLKRQDVELAPVYNESGIRREGEEHDVEEAGARGGPT
jgi:hypothetical protein